MTFRCPVAKQRALKFVYLQRRKTFVNGYHMTKDLSVLAWKNTRMDDDNRTIHMFDLNMSHSGDYRCVIHYIGSANQIVETTIHLAVTGMSVLTFKNVFDRLSFGLFANTLQRYDTIYSVF